MALSGRGLRTAPPWEVGVVEGISFCCWQLGRVIGGLLLLIRVLGLFLLHAEPCLVLGFHRCSYLKGISWEDEGLWVLFPSCWIRGMVQCVSWRKDRKHVYIASVPSTESGGGKKP